MPALGAARVTARLIQCGSNQHQIGIAFHAYAADTGDRLPYAGYFNGVSTVQESISFDDALARYMSRDLDRVQRDANSIPLEEANPAMMCPADPVPDVINLPEASRSYTMTRAGYDSVDPDALPRGVGIIYVNPASLGPVRVPEQLRLGTSDIAAPSAVFAMTERSFEPFSGFFKSNLQGQVLGLDPTFTEEIGAVVTDHPQEQHRVWHTTPFERPEVIHGSDSRPQANYLYVDGHVAILDIDQTNGEAGIAASVAGGPWTRQYGD